MREIKFRVWDDYLQKMRGHTDPSTIQAVVFHQQLKKGDTGRYVIEQFTGLQDKNGKDIYEGDIVAHKDIIEPGAAIQWSEHEFSWSVGEGWPIIEFYDGAEGLQAGCEIIGNIHENPELVKE